MTADLVAASFLRLKEGNMERIMIIGCGGAGKSTLARQLGEKTGLPVVHLDRIFWSPGNWQHLDRAEFDALLTAEAEKDRWIIDGNYDRTLELRLAKADTVIYLDFPRWLCLAGWFKRVITHWGKARPDMAPGCKEWFDPEFVKWLWKYNKENRQRNYELIKKYPNAKPIILKNRRQVRAFLSNL